MIQKRALRSIYPGVSYNDIDKLPTLASRSDELCKMYFNKMKQSIHKLNHLLPNARDVPYSLRSSNVYPLVKARTHRYKNSLIRGAWLIVKVNSSRIIYVFLFQIIVYLNYF